MKRPLLAVCIGLVMILAIWMTAGGSYPGGEAACAEESSLHRNGLQEGPVVVTGNVYRKDTKQFFLKSVAISNIDTNSKSPETGVAAADLQQRIPFYNNFTEGSLVCDCEGKAPKIGSTVTLRGNLVFFEKATNPGEFDEARYYGSLGLDGKITDISGWQEGEEYSRWRERLFEIRYYFRNRLYQIFPEKEASIMTAMLLGDKIDLDPETKELYQNNGIIHILSISGLHITLIGMSIYRLLRRMGLPVWAAAMTGGTVLVFYGVMTGMSISACRAIGMFVLRMLALLCGRTYDMMTALGVMAVCLLAGNPLQLQNAGFLLSFGAVAGIGVLYPALTETMVLPGEAEIQFNAGWTFGGIGQLSADSPYWKRLLVFAWKHWGEGLWQSFLSGLSVTAMTLPIQLWFYYEIPVYSVFLNLLVLPFMMYVMLAGLLAMLIPGLGILGTVDCVILGIYEWLCRQFAKLPFSVWNPGRPRVWQMVVYYGLLLFVVAVQGTNLRDLLQKKSEKEFGKIRAFLLWSAEFLLYRVPGKLVIVAAAVLLFAFRLPAETVITFLDVGQGDCICMQLASGEVYLFDCGSSSRSRVGEYVLKPFLKYKGISYVNGVFVSHGDSDHCNGIAELLEHQKEWGITVGRLVLSEEGMQKEMPGLNMAYRFEDRMPDGQEDILQIKTGDCIEGDGYIIQCLHPPENSLLSEDAVLDSNAASQCFYVEFAQGESLLFTGDVEGEGEELLLKELQKRSIRDLTLLKVAHHGSKYSGSTELLMQLTPQVAVISCGENNRYGHPHQETLERLEEAGSRILSTPDYGAITVKIGRNVKIYGYK